MRAAGLALLLVVIGSTHARAERQIKPFIGSAFGGGTTFVDVEDAADSPTVVFGANGVLLGEVLGLDMDVGYSPGFFEAGSQDFVLSSSVTTLSGSVIVALPRRWAEVGLRPYFVGGGGLMHVRINQTFDLLKVARTLAAVNLGGGVTGFLTDRLGLSWEVRHFRSVGGDPGGSGLSFGRERLSFWRGTMAVAVRY